jgi:hypothetical protein
MIRLCVLGLLASLEITAAGTESDTKLRTDRYGDPLPARAVLAKGQRGHTLFPIGNKVCPHSLGGDWTKGGLIRGRP